MGKDKELKVYGTSTLEESLEYLRNKDERYRILLDSFDTSDAIMKKLVELRKEAGLSQRDLARLTGMRQPQIARYETLDEYPRLDTFLRIIDALKYQISLEKKSNKSNKPSKNSSLEAHEAK